MAKSSSNAIPEPKMGEVDFGRRSGDYSEHRPGFPQSFYERLEAIAPISGSRVVDLATGPAVMAIDMAKREAHVTGVDISENQIDAARLRVDAVGLSDRCRFLQASAEDTKLEGGFFNWVTAGQCWHWFDVPSALDEARRLLTTSGHLVIAHYSYLPSLSQAARLSEELVLKHNPSWTMANHSGLYPNQIDAVVESGFNLVEQFCYHHDEAFSHEKWCGRMRTCNGVGSRAVGSDAVAAYDQDLKELLAKRFDDPLTVVHRVWAVVAKKVH